MVIPPWSISHTWYGSSILPRFTFHWNDLAFTFGSFTPNDARSLRLRGRLRKTWRFAAVVELAQQWREVNIR